MKIWLFILYLIFIMSSNVNAQSDTVANGTLGDVKYSILEPADFMRLNPGWVLMQGQNISGTKLADLYRLKTLPDARGLFIRAMNMDRDTKTGDGDGNRAVGETQDDALGSHNHAWLANTKSFSYGGIPGEGGDGGTNEITRHTEYMGKNETRPRNIALYVYIKIN